MNFVHTNVGGSQNVFSQFRYYSFNLPDILGPLSQLLVLGGLALVGGADGGGQGQEIQDEKSQKENERKKGRTAWRDPGGRWFMWRVCGWNTQQAAGCQRGTAG